MIDYLFTPMDCLEQYEVLSSISSSIRTEDLPPEKLEIALFSLETLKEAFLYSYLHYLKTEISEFTWEQER